jgi:hypothetical protein
LVAKEEGGMPAGQTWSNPIKADQACGGGGLVRTTKMEREGPMGRMRADQGKTNQNKVNQGESN